DPARRDARGRRAGAARARPARGARPLVLERARRARHRRGRLRRDGEAGRAHARPRGGGLMRRPLVIAWKELVQLRRDRLTLAMAIALPVMQIALFGYAINTDVRHIPTVVFDQDGSADSRDLAATLVATRFYDVVGQVRSYEEIERALR